MAEIQIQARALGDPTRHQVFRYVAEAPAPVDVAELTAHFGLNHNAIRQHLAKLVDAGLVVESVASPSGRGRPRLRYGVAPSAESRWGVTGPYERLAMMLTEVVSSGDTPLEVGRRFGFGPGSEPPDGGDGSTAALADAMERQGFEPTVAALGDGAEITLHRCPFASAVLTDPGTICQLHLGLAHGIAEGVGGIEIDELIPRDPRTAQCTLHVRLTTDRGKAAEE